MIPLSGDLAKAKGIKSENVDSVGVTRGTSTLKRGFAHMLKNGVVMDVTTVEQAQLAEEAGAVSVMVLDKLPSDVRKAGGVARTASIRIIQDIMDSVTIPVMAKCRIGHVYEAKVLAEANVDMVDESEVLTPADENHHIWKWDFTTPFVNGARSLAEALRRIEEGAAMIRTKGEPGTGNVAEAVLAENPNQLLAYNCSPSFNWKKNLNDTEIASFQEMIAEMGYKYQFITLAGIHNMWYNMFDLAYDYAKGEGMKHYVNKVQEPEFEAAKKGYTFASHQQEVGAGYFDDVTTVIQGGLSSVTALTGSTEEEQFN